MANQEKEKSIMPGKRAGFTLIELLIVVAIIAILAAIAVPNFLEAQTRARVSRVKNDLRTFGIALESYKLDNNQIPMVSKGAPFFPTFLDILNDPNKRARYPGHLLTSPIAYVTSNPMDFYNTNAAKKTSWSKWGKEVEVSYVISWAPMGLGDYKSRDGWVLNPRKTGESMADFFTCDYFHAMVESTGPDLFWWDLGGNSSQSDVNPFFYDPTNGTISWGQIVWLDCGGIQAPR
jgi:type II secretion system protein G